MKNFSTKILSTFALLLAISACESPVSTRPEAAYDPTALTNGLFYRWQNGSAVKVFVVQTGLAGTIDLSGAVSRAINVWNAVPQYDEVQLVSAASAAEANIIVYDASVPIPVQPSSSCTFDSHGAGGYTYFCNVSTSGSAATKAVGLPLVSGGGSPSVVIRVDRGRVTTAAAYDALVAHEFGHALGIGAHSNSPSDLMFINPSVAAPTDRDKATLRFALGQVANFTL